MGLGKMNHPIQIITTEQVPDTEGFATSEPTVVAEVRAYKETRNSTAKWERITNQATFTSVNTLFRFRTIPGLTVTTSHFIHDADGVYNIVSVEDVRGRGMYYEVLASKTDGSK